MPEPGGAPELAARAAAVLAIPLHRYLGLVLADDRNPSAGVVLEVTEAALNQANLLHGGIVTALLDVASYLALAPHLAAHEHAVTHELSVQLLRPVPAGARLLLTGQVLRRGRQVAFLRAEAHSGPVLVATAQVTKSVVPAT